ncbi:MAG: hypothetical protein WCP20_09870 [Desulfuromonadales bacterium]
MLTSLFAFAAQPLVLSGNNDLYRLGGSNLGIPEYTTGRLTIADVTSPRHDMILKWGIILLPCMAIFLPLISPLLGKQLVNAALLPLILVSLSAAIYGKKRLREIDRKLKHLGARLKLLKVSAPPANPTVVSFGCWVGYEDEEGNARCYQLAGGRRFSYPGFAFS